MHAAPGTCGMHAALVFRDRGQARPAAASMARAPALT